MKKLLLIGSLLIAVFLISGCAISDYITGVEEDESYSLLEEEEVEEETEEVEEEIEEVEEEEIDEEAIVITVKEAETVNLKPKAKDADEDMITYSFSEPLDNSGRWVTGYGDAGEYLITVTASDGELETSRQVLLVVERVNVPPEITGVPDEVEIDEGEILALSPEASDPNGDAVELTISEPVGDDGEWIIGYQESGEYFVDISATDGELETVKKILVTVKRKNVAPVLENVEDEIIINEGEVIVLSPVVTDLNGDDVEVTITEPVGDNGIWETQYTDHGEYVVTVTADDGEAQTIQEVMIIVNDINVAPVIDDIVQEG
ncbi:hypothetical protein KY332_04175 [Candidatus Woesearchaeota archaeon]|nr:hypothetical protein [Candidatus Woesearchaeota archaeon]